MAASVRRARNGLRRSGFRSDLPALLGELRLLVRAGLGLGFTRATADVADLDDAWFAAALLPASLELEMLRLAGHVEGGHPGGASPAALEPCHLGRNCGERQHRDDLARVALELVAEGLHDTPHVSGDH